VNRGQRICPQVCTVVITFVVEIAQSPGSVPTDRLSATAQNYSRIKGDESGKNDALGLVGFVGLVRVIRFVWRKILVVNFIDHLQLRTELLIATEANLVTALN
jgi:hypothetical protein